MGGREKESVGEREINGQQMGEVEARDRGEGEDGKERVKRREEENRESDPRTTNMREP